MLKSFKDYREAVSPSSNTHQQAATIQGVINKLCYTVHERFEILIHELGERSLDSSNPFNIMRQNRPWHQKVRSWWRRFWNNDQHAESQEYGLEFDDDFIIAEHEQEAFNELLMLEGPVNEAYMTMVNLLRSLKNQINKDITNQLGEYAGLVPRTVPHQANVGTQSGSNNPASVVPEPVVPGPTGPTTEPDISPIPPEEIPLGTDAQTPLKTTPPDTPVAPKKPNVTHDPFDPSLKSSNKVEKIEVWQDPSYYGLPQYAWIEGSDRRMGVDYAKYDFHGNLVAIRVTDKQYKKKGWFDVPSKLGELAAIKYGAQQGKVKDIQNHIASGGGPQTDHSAIAPESPPSPMPVSSPSTEPPPLPKSEPGDERVHQDPDRLIDDVGETAAKKAAEEEQRRESAAKARKKASAENRVMEYLASPEVHNIVNHKLLNSVLNLPEDSQQRQSFFHFLSPMSDDTKMIFMAKRSDVLDGPSEDGEKLQWILGLGKEKAQELGIKLQDLHNDHGDVMEFYNDVKRIFDDPVSFSEFIGVPLETFTSRGKVMVERLRRNKNTETDR